MKKVMILFLFVLLIMFSVNRNIKINPVNTNNSTTITSTSTTDNVDPNLELKLSSNLDVYGGYTIDSAAYTGSSTNIVIPSEYEGKKITSIGASAFSNLNNITNIFLSNGIIEIGESAFANLASLEYVSLPASLIYIKASAFANTGLKYAYIPESVIEIGSQSYSYCTKMVEFVVASKTIKTYNQDFNASINATGKYYCNPNLATTFKTNAANVTFTSTSTFANDTNFFYNITSKNLLRVITTNSEVTAPAIYSGTQILYVGGYCFNNTSYLKKVTFAEGYTIISGENDTVGGVFINSGVEEIILPTTVYKLGKNSFANIPNLKTITIPGNITQVYENLFGNSPLLEIVYFTSTSGVKFVSGMFSNATALRFVYVGGTVTLDTSLTFATCFTNCPKFENILALSPTAYSNNKTVFSTGDWANKLNYQINVKYELASTFLDPTFIDTFQSELNKKLEPSINSDNNVYFYTVGEELLIPTITDIKDIPSFTGDYIYSVYTSYNKDSNIFSGKIDDTKSSDNGYVTAGILTETCPFELNIYVELALDVTNKPVESTGVYLYDTEGNVASDGNVTLEDISNVYTLQFQPKVEIANVISLPVNYQYEYSWSINKEKDPNLTTKSILIQLSDINSLNYQYVCNVKITDSLNNTVITNFSQTFQFTYTKIDLEVSINDQKLSTGKLLSANLGTDYVVTKNGKKVTEDQLHEIFGDRYGLYATSEGTISFFGEYINDKYKDAYSVVITKEGSIDFTKVFNTTNLLIYSAAAGIFVIISIGIITLIRVRTRKEF